MFNIMCERAVKTTDKDGVSITFCEVLGKGVNHRINPDNPPCRWCKYSPAYQDTGGFDYIDKLAEILSQGISAEKIAHLRVDTKLPEAVSILENAIVLAAERKELTAKQAEDVAVEIGLALDEEREDGDIATKD